MAGHEVTRLQRAPAKLANRVATKDAPHELSFVERVTLFVCAMHRERALELVEGFAPAQRQAARAFSRQVADWNSSARQARLTHDFGARADAPDRIRALLAAASPLMREALLYALPQPLRVIFPDAELPDPARVTPLLTALANRLVREAIR